MAFHSDDVTYRLARDRRYVSLPKFSGYYLSPDDQSENPSPSWIHFRYEPIPLSDAELGRIGKSARGDAVEGTWEAFARLSATHQGVVRSMISMEQARERTDHARWVISHVDVQTSAASTEKILLVLERIDGALPTTVFEPAKKREDSRLDSILEQVNSDPNSLRYRRGQMVPTNRLKPSAPRQHRHYSAGPPVIHINDELGRSHMAVDASKADHKGATSSRRIWSEQVLPPDSSRRSLPTEGVECDDNDIASAESWSDFDQFEPSEESRQPGRLEEIDRPEASEQTNLFEFSRSRMRRPSPPAARFPPTTRSHPSNVRRSNPRDLYTLDDELREDLREVRSDNAEYGSPPRGRLRNLPPTGAEVNDFAHLRTQAAQRARLEKQGNVSHELGGENRESFERELAQAELRRRDEARRAEWDRESQRIRDEYNASDLKERLKRDQEAARQEARVAEVASKAVAKALAREESARADEIAAAISKTRDEAEKKAAELAEKVDKEHKTRLAQIEKRHQTELEEIERAQGKSETKAVDPVGTEKKTVPDEQQKVKHTKHEVFSLSDKKAEMELKREIAIRDDEIEHLRAQLHTKREPDEDQHAQLHITKADADEIIDRFAERCFELLDLESTKAWFREGNDSSEQAETLILDFTFLLGRASEWDGALDGLLWLLQQQRGEIVTRLRALLLGEHYAKSSRRTLATSEWLSAIDGGLAPLRVRRRHWQEERRLSLDSEQDAPYAGHKNTTDPEEPPLSCSLDDLRKAFLTPEFEWFTATMEWQSRFIHSGTSVLETRSQLVRNLAALPLGSSLQLDLKWDPQAFLHQQFSGNIPHLAKVIVFCGLAKSAYATSIGEYVRMLWPRSGSLVLDCIQSAYSSTSSRGKDFEASVSVHSDSGRDNNFSRSTQSRPDGDESLPLIVQFESGRTLIQIPEFHNVRTVIEIAEVCTWLAIACRENDLEDCVAYSSIDLRDEPQPESGGLEIAPRLRTFDTSQDGLCWCRMVRNPVIAKGYPVPTRDRPTEQKGLEVSLDLMIALAHAYWATNFEASFVIKGLISALVPVLEAGSSLVWHFILNEDGRRMTYPQACESASNLNLHGRKDLEARRHFVGIWSPSARIMAGGDDQSLYSDVQLSSSKPLEHYTVSLSNLSISAGQYLTVGGAFVIAKKDSAPSLQKVASRPYEVHIRHASRIPVVFYGTQDRRAWMVDGATALMHLARSWMSCEGNVTPNELNRLAYRHPRGGRASAVEALARNQHSNIRIFGDSESTWQNIESMEESDSDPYSSDSGYHSTRTSRKLKHKTVTSEWSYKALVLDIWHVLETMYDKLHGAKFHSPEFSIKRPTSKPILSGWETRDILTERGPFSPRAVELKMSAEPWLQYVKEKSAIVLLAQTFGDLILPNSRYMHADQCSRLLRMPTGCDNLAVPLYVLYPGAKRFLRGNEDCSGGCVQITDKTYWHSFEAKAHECQDICACKTVSTMGSKARYHTAPHATHVNVFTKYPDGVAIIGEIEKTSRWPQWIPSPTRSNQSSGHQSRQLSPEGHDHHQDLDLDKLSPVLTPKDSDGSPSPPATRHMKEPLFLPTPVRREESSFLRRSTETATPNTRTRPVPQILVTPSASYNEWQAEEDDLDDTHFDPQSTRGSYPSLHSLPLRPRHPDPSSDGTMSPPQPFRLRRSKHSPGSLRRREDSSSSRLST